MAAEDPGVTRRSFLRLAALSALAAGCRAPGLTPGATATGPGPGPATPVPVEPAPEALLITPVAKFYKQSFSSVPEVDVAAWQLTIDGLVERPIRLSFNDLRALPAVEIMRTLECIGNPVGGSLIGNAVWKGVYLKPLLDLAGIRPAARRIRFEAADGYDTAVELKFIDEARSFLAYEMNGLPLTPEHGYPLRVFFPGSYGQKMPKWVTRLEAIDYDHEGYWERQGWSDVAQVKTNSIILQPYANARLGGQRLAIWGVAYAGKRAITQVEVRVDRAEWAPARLLPGPSSEVWTQWVYDWQPAEPGSHKIAVRATDETGFTQFKTADGVLDGFPDGSDAIHAVFVKSS